MAVKNDGPLPVPVLGDCRTGLGTDKSGVVLWMDSYAFWT